jgi:hypothetical protein
MYDAVAVKLDAMAGGSRKENPPEGVIFHAAGFSEGDMVVFDVWESREAWERFESDRLVPAIRSVMEEAGVTEGPQARVKIFELHEFMRG